MGSSSTPPSTRVSRRRTPRSSTTTSWSGLAAYDVSGERLGELTAVTHGAAQDLLTIRTPDGRDTLVPFVAALVPEVDVTGGRIVIADRPGLVAPYPDTDPAE